MFCGRAPAKDSPRSTLKTVLEDDRSGHASAITALPQPLTNWRAPYQASLIKRGF